jgi:hypothetical protein
VSEQNLDELLNRPYPGTGNLGQAIVDFEHAVCTGLTNSWPRYWKEFSNQAFADLIALEVRIKELEEENKKFREALEKIAGEDFRGPRPTSATIAFEALKEFK